MVKHVEYELLLVYVYPHPLTSDLTYFIYTFKGKDFKYLFSKL